MTISSKVKNMLDKEHVTYQVLEHEPAFTAMEVAGAQHVPGRQFVKCVVVIADERPVMCVLPAIHKLNLEKLQKEIKARQIRLANEKEITLLFPDYETGAEPPLDLPSGMKLYVDKCLEENNEIAFNAGTHTDVLKVRFKDFCRLTKPTIIDFGIHI